MLRLILFFFLLFFLLQYDCAPEFVCWWVFVTGYFGVDFGSAEPVAVLQSSQRRQSVFHTRENFPRLRCSWSTFLDTQCTHTPHTLSPLICGCVDHHLPTVPTHSDVHVWFFDNFLVARNGSTKKFAFIEFAEEATAKKAVAEMPTSDFKGASLEISISKVKTVALVKSCDCALARFCRSITSSKQLLVSTSYHTHTHTHRLVFWLYSVIGENWLGPPPAILPFTLVLTNLFQTSTCTSTHPGTAHNTHNTVP